VTVGKILNDGPEVREVAPVVYMVPLSIDKPLNCGTDPEGPVGPGGPEGPVLLHAGHITSIVVSHLQ
jgi:hypothetical protein